MEKKHNVLVVDDDPTIVDFLREILEEGYNLLTVNSGEEALEKLHQFNPDVILLDIMMGGIDGYETCQIIRSDLKHEDAKIVFLSAKVTLNERLKGYDVGGDDFITKPFEMDELLAKVNVFSNMKHKGTGDIKGKSKYNEKQLEVFFKVQHNLKQIVYIKSESPYCYMHFDVSNATEIEKIRTTVQALSDYFEENILIRVHRSYLVNSKKIESITFQKNNELKILLKKSEKQAVSVPVGRSYHAKIRNIFPNFFEG